MNSISFNFLIPLKRDDLLSNQSPDQYVVSQIFRGNELTDKLQECKQCAREMGCDFILEHFGTLFSVLQNFRDLDFKFLHSFYNDVIVKELTQLYNTLHMILQEEDFHQDLRHKMLNVTKMMLYVVVEFLKSFQEKVDKAYSLVINEKRKKNTKLLRLKEDHNMDWEENERATLVHIQKIISLPLQRLWDPPMAEEEFVRMIEDCCYSVLEKQTITSVKMKPTRDVIFDILAILIKQYNNAISCKVKFVQMLKLYEHVVPILSQAVIFFVEKHNCKSLVKEVILEIIETGGEMDNYTQDNSSSRAFSNFIIEIAKQQPELIFPCVNLLKHNLDCDPYNMRICVLSVMSEIVVHVLRSNENNPLSDENKKMRDQFIEHLLDHIVDVNVFVRSKVLKLWQSMCEHNSVPKNYIIPLLDHTIRRLRDKSSTVVKYAIQLIRVMLEQNIFGPALERETVKQHLQSLKENFIEKENAKNDPSKFKIWFFSKVEISEYFTKNLTNTDDNEEEETSPQQNSRSADESSKVELTKSISQLQNYVFMQDFPSIYSTLVELEKKHIQKIYLLKSVDDKVMYYEWLLGNLCKEDAGSICEALEKLSDCSNYSHVKRLLNEPILLENKDDEEFIVEKNVISYCENYYKFTELINSASTIIGELMMGKSSAEVLEAIYFFKSAHQFNISGAEIGLKNMLLLINSKEAGFKEAVVATYKGLYLESEKQDKYEAAVEAVDRLISLLKRVTHEQKKALANLIKQWVLNGDIGQEFILVLWEKYSRKMTGVSLEDSTAAAVLICMYASGKPEVIKTNIDLLTKYGLGAENRKNYLFVKYTCQMLRVLYGMKNENGGLIKYPVNSELFECLISLVEEQFSDFKNSLYPEIAMEAISNIYQLSEYPDTSCAKIIAFLSNELSLNKVAEQVTNEIPCNEELLARFVLIVGQIAFCQWHYLENDVLNELKHRSLEANAKRKNMTNKSRSSNCTSLMQKSVSENTTTTDNFEDDAQALAGERIADSIRIVCENELLYGDTVLAKLSALIVKICQHPVKFPGDRLKSAASLSLSKLMMISSDFCSKYIQLFVTLLEKTTEPEVKINLILAFGDLTFRFPNTIEPWTVYFYNRLKDDSPNVRYTALIVISHLITNEMVKVRSQMSDVALCLVDLDKCIRNHAYQLFYELSQKGNTLYNVMPDIISRLSHPDYRTDEKDFQTILKILMKLITTDRHLVSIVEKLCHRLRGAVDERQCIDLSYCLTIVTYSEKSFQKLLDNIICYADKLNYARVHKNFTNITISCKKTKQSKLTEMTQELEDKINIILTKGIDNLDADFLKPPKTPSRGGKTPMKTPKTRNASTRKNSTLNASVRKSTRSVRKRVEFNSEDEDE